MPVQDFPNSGKGWEEISPHQKFCLGGGGDFFTKW